MDCNNWNILFSFVLHILLKKIAILFKSLYLYAMLKAFKYRLYPTRDQETLINKHIGGCRFVYNLALETKQMAYAGSKVNLSCFDLNKQLPDLKNECEWLKEINSQSLQQSITNMDVAFTRFFKGQSDFPKFKKKSSAQSFSVPQKVFVFDGLLNIPKFKTGIPIVLSRPIKGVIRSATISRTPTGKYFASILCETGEEIPEKRTIKEDTSIGIDLGIKSFLATSDGKIFDNPKFLSKAQSRLKFTQSKYSKHKGKRTKKRLVLLHEKVANQRKNFLHKLSADIVKSHDTICVEDLNIAGLLKNHCIAQSIADAGWGMFINMIKYKSEWRGVNVLKIGRFEPSSKTCSICGHVNKDLTLKDRFLSCECGNVLDRDVNAAINIKNFALKNNLSGEHRLKNRNELPTLVGVLTCEVATIKT